jgi:monothiol glutaredoxin
MSRDVQQEIDQLVKSKPIVLFMKGTPGMPQCGFSFRTVEALKACQVPFEAVNVLADPDVREGIKLYGRWPTIPQLYVNGKLLGGCDITLAMFENGELQTMLQSAAQPSA